MSSRWKTWGVEYHQEGTGEMVQIIVRARTATEALSKANYKFEKEYGEVTRENMWWISPGGIRLLGGNGEDKWG